MPLCSQTDVEHRLQIDFDDDTEPVIAALILAAQGHIEREVGRPIEADDHTELFDGPRGAYLWLTNTPVNSIASITVDGVPIVEDDDFYFTSYGKVGRISGGYLRHWDSFKPNVVEVTYNGGYVTVPLDLRDICARAAARAFQAGAAFAAAPAVAVAVRSVSLEGSDSVTFGESVSDVTALVSLTEAEIAACRYYRTVVLA